MDRTNTGINGLDEVLDGGFPKNRTIMVTGGPGSAKSTFCMQFLCNGAREYDEPGIYVTLGESPKNLIDNLAYFDFGISDLVENNMLSFLDLSITAGERGGVFVSNKLDINLLSKTLGAVKKKVGAKRIVIDPITAMIISLDISEIREKLTLFANFSNELECTTLMTSEIPTGRDTISVFGVEEFVVDGVVIMHHIQQKDVKIRGIEILKMRGTDHGHRIYPMNFTKQGLEVSPEGRIFGEF
ncbi:MAG: ATPase domain-containing protein [Candidatus Hydrothermarchaeales archaeon]